MLFCAASIPMILLAASLESQDTREIVQLPLAGSCTQRATAIRGLVAAWIRLEVASSTTSSISVSVPPVMNEPSPPVPFEPPVPVSVERMAWSPRLTASLLFSLSSAERFTESWGGRAAATYWPWDRLGAELSFAGFNASETELTQEFRENFPGQEPPLPDLHQIDWMLDMSVRLKGYKGRLGLTKELSLVFDGNLFGGVGLADVRRELTVGDSQSELVPAFHVGLSWTAYLSHPALGLRVDLRDSFFADPGQDGLTHNVHAQLGIEVAFSELFGFGAPVDPFAERAAVGSMAGRLEIMPFVAQNFDPNATDTSLGGILVYHLAEAIGVELGFCKTVVDELDLSARMIDQGGLMPSLVRQTQILWTAAMGLRFTPFTGQMRIVDGWSPLDLGAYFVVGGGFGATRTSCTPGMSLDPNRFDPAICPNSTDADGLVYEPTTIRFVGTYALGLRAGILDRVGVSLELRHWVFPLRIFRPDSTEPTEQFSDSIEHLRFVLLGVSVVI